MDSFIILGLALQTVIILASIMGYISTGQYMKEARAMIRANVSVSKKMWMLVVILPTLYAVLPFLGSYVGMRVGDLAFPLGLLMYACMFIGTKKILAPVFGEKKDALWKFAVIYPGATFLLNVALMMIVGQVAAYMLFSF